MDEALHRMATEGYRTLVLPASGFGTGVASLPQHAPRTAAFLAAEVARVKEALGTAPPPPGMALDGAAVGQPSSLYPSDDTSLFPAHATSPFPATATALATAPPPPPAAPGAVAGEMVGAVPSDADVAAAVEEASRLAAAAAIPNAEAAAASAALDEMWSRMAIREEQRGLALGEAAAPPPSAAAAPPLAPPPDGASREEQRAYRAAIRKAAVANIRNQVAEIDEITKDTKSRYSASS